MYEVRLMLLLSAAAVEDRLKHHKRNRTLKKLKDWSSIVDLTEKRWSAESESRENTQNPTDLNMRMKWEDETVLQSPELICTRLGVPIHMTADRLFKSLHSSVWLQQLQTLVWSVSVVIPVCAGEIRKRWLLSQHNTRSVKNAMSDCVCLCRASAHSEGRWSLNLRLNQRLSQLSHFLFTRHQHGRLPAVSEAQRVRRERIILRPL